MAVPHGKSFHRLASLHTASRGRLQAALSRYEEAGSGSLCWALSPRELYPCISDQLIHLTQEGLSHLTKGGALIPKDGGLSWELGLRPQCAASQPQDKKLTSVGPIPRGRGEGLVWERRSRGVSQRQKVEDTGEKVVGWGETRTMWR